MYSVYPWEEATPNGKQSVRNQRKVSDSGMPLEQPTIDIWYETKQGHFSIEQI